MHPPASTRIRNTAFKTFTFIIENILSFLRCFCFHKEEHVCVCCLCLLCILFFVFERREKREGRCESVNVQTDRQDIILGENVPVLI